MTRATSSSDIVGNSGSVQICSRQPLGDRQAALAEAELGVGLGPVDRERVVHRGRDAALAEERAQRVAPLRAHDEQVVDVVAARGRGRGKLDARAREAVAQRARRGGGGRRSSRRAGAASPAAARPAARRGARSCRRCGGGSAGCSPCERRRRDARRRAPRRRSRPRRRRPSRRGSWSGRTRSSRCRRTCRRAGRGSERRAPGAQSSITRRPARARDLEERRPCRPSSP